MSTGETLPHQRGIDVLEELKIMKATSSDSMLNIGHNINPLYQILHSVQDQTIAHADTADNAK